MALSKHTRAVFIASPLFRGEIIVKELIQIPRFSTAIVSRVRHDEYSTHDFVRLCIVSSRGNDDGPGN